MIKTKPAKSIIEDTQLLRVGNALVKIIIPVLHVLRLFDRDIPMGFVCHAMSDLASSVGKLAELAECPRTARIACSESWSSVGGDASGHSCCLLVEPEASSAA
jgi:hypothetical protein